MTKRPRVPGSAASPRPTKSQLRRLRKRADATADELRRLGIELGGDGVEVRDVTIRRE